MMDAGDLELFTRSVRAALDGGGGRREDVDAALDALGWRDALADDPRAAVSVLFSAQGEANATSSALPWLLGTDVLPAIGTSAPPARVLGRDRLCVCGLALGPLAGDDVTMAATSGDGDDVVVDVRVRVSALSTRPVDGIDPSLGLVLVLADAVDHRRGGRRHQPGWEGAVALGRIALAHELVGASRAMLRLAREHALERVQFDRPIAQFQAVRHRLADTLVAIETADAANDAAWLDRSHVNAAMAKAVAGRSARTAARHCQQVLAGIGFTTEHPLHRHVRRVLVLDQLLGASRTLTSELGAGIVASGQLPPLLPL